MRDDNEAGSLVELLELLARTAPERGSVSLSCVIEIVGRRSFGPLLLIAGLITVAPLIGDIPGVPTLIGVLVFLLAAQLVAGRQCLWLPKWLLRKSVSADKLHKALAWSSKPARFIDRLLKPRLTALTEGNAVRMVAAACMVISAAMPAMEFVPFSANIAGAALTAFGLSLIAHDGLLAAFAIALTAGAVWAAVTLL